MLLYEPSYLADVIEYYAPGITARPVGTAVPAGAGTVWVLATDRVVNTEDTAAKVGSVLADLEQDRTLVDTVEPPERAGVGVAVMIERQTTAGQPDVDGRAPRATAPAVRRSTPAWLTPAGRRAASTVAAALACSC